MSISTAHISTAPSTTFGQHVRPRVAFLGTGWIGRSRLEALAKADIAEIVCIADTDRTAAEQCALAYAPQCARGVSLKDALSCEPDAVVIATPSALHARQAVAALREGASVFCQKPLACTRLETEDVIDAAREADRLLAVDLSYRFTRAAQSVREIVQSGELGEIHAINLVFHNAYSPSKQWARDPRLAGGGCVIDLGVHVIDLALWMLDSSVDGAHGRLYAAGRRLQAGEAAVEDFASAQIDLTNGAVASLATSWNVHGGSDAIIEATFYGTKGGASLRNVNGSFYDFTALRFTGASTQTIVEPPDDWPGRALLEWVRQLSCGGSYDAGVESLLPVAQAIDMMYGRDA